MRIKWLNTLILVALVLGLVPLTPALSSAAMGNLTSLTSAPESSILASTDAAKDVSESLIVVGDLVTYTIVLTAGTTTQLWSLYDPLPEGLGFVSVDGADYDSDTHSINWSGSLGTGMAALLEESFEGAFPPPGWSLYASSGENWGQSSTRAYSGNYSASRDRAVGVGDAWLITPQIPVPADGAALSFWEFVLPNNQPTRSLWVCSENCGAPSTNWSLIAQLPGISSPPWKQVQVDLNPYAGQAIYVGFRYQGDDNRAWYVDDILIEGEIDIASHTITLVVEGQLPGYYTNVAYVDVQGTTFEREAPELWVVSTAGFTLDVDIVGNGDVAVDPDEEVYFYGDQVTLTASADPGWTFAGWSGDAAGTESAVTITITGNTVVTATFTPEAYTLDVNIVGSGDVTVDPDEEVYFYGDEVTLTASADPGWAFAGWSGDAAGTDSAVTITITGDTVVTATFTPGAYMLDVNIVGSGDVTVDPDEDLYAYGDQVTLTAIPAPGWSFAGWSGDATGTNPEITVTIDGDTTVTATFEPEAYTLNVVVTPIGSGTVSVSPMQATYAYGDEVTLTATAAPGWSFVDWSGDATGTNPVITVTIEGDTAVTATFTEEEAPVYRIMLPLVRRN